MLIAVHAQPVVDLVREDHELVLARDLDDLLQDLARVDRARGVVGVDDDDGLRARDTRSRVVGDVGAPFGLLIADVVHGDAAGERGAGGPERVVRAGDEDLVAVVQKRVERELDELRDAVARVDAVHRDVRQPLDLRVLHDGLARGEEAARIRVALAIGQLLAHVGHDLVRCAEAEGRGVADVQFEDAQALGFHPGGLIGHGAADVVENVVELGGLSELAHGGAPLGRRGLAGGRGTGGLRPRGSSRGGRGRRGGRHGLRGAGARRRGRGAFPPSRAIPGWCPTRPRAGASPWGAA